MSLAWVCEECPTPFGAIRTYNWAVPDEDPSNNYDPEAIGFNEDEEEIALEPAQDQLGSVLWNSNSVALDHFAQLVIYQEAKDSGDQSIITTAFGGETADEGEEKSFQKSKRQRTEGGEDETTSSDAAGSARYLAVSKEVLAKKNILELGSGVGVLGIALSLYGGAKVAITDIKELVPLMEKNIRESAKKVIPLTMNAPQKNANADNNQLKNLGKGGNSNLKQNNKTSSSKGGSSAAVAAYATTIEGRGAKDHPSERGGTCRAFAFRWGEPYPQTLASYLGPRVHFIAMCDALYGNPTEWPKLIQNLKEIVAVAKKSIEDDERDSDEESPKASSKNKETNGTEGENEGAITSLKVDGSGHKLRKSFKLPVIVNYCEQRVDEVEGPFLKLLREVVPEWKVCGPTVLPTKSGMGMEVRVTTIYTR